jgi:hypothetical protein
MCVVGNGNNGSFLTQKILSLGSQTRGNNSWICGVISIQREQTARSQWEQIVIPLKSIS